MEVAGRSYAWEVERMRHQQSSADGKPSTSGRADAEDRASGERPLRSVALLPRSSRNGTDSLPLQSADDVAQNEETASPRTGDLRARAPSAVERGATAAPMGQRTRRGSIADFLGIGAGRDGSAAPSREVTMQGTGAALPAGRRSRRASVMQTFGFGHGATPAPESEAADATASPGLDLAPRPSLGARSKTGGSTSQGRRRRASMLDLFRPSQTAAAEESAEDSSRHRQLLRSKSSVKSRRASVMDFFRSSNTGLVGTEDGSTSIGRTTSRALRGEGNISTRHRRRSVIDILGHSSKKVFAKLMNQEFEEPVEGGDEPEEGRLWFSSLADFKPLTFKYLTGRYSSAFFACSVKTGEHYILKQFEKSKMSTADERGVKRALAFAHDLEHEHIVQCCGTWEDEQALYIVEEYAIKGDLLQDSMSHPEKYTEAFMATKVIKPLLEVLVYLHSIDVIHRSIFPEYVLFGREDKLKLGHFTSAINQRMDTPNERIPFLDYMAPEMLSVRLDGVALYGPGWSASSNPSVRGKVPSSQQTKVVLMQYSNDGSQRATQPHSPASPIQLGSPFGRRRSLLSPTNLAARRQAPGGDDIPGLAGFLPQPEAELSDRSAPSRTGMRSPLSLFRRLSPHQLTDDEVTSGSRDTSTHGGPPRRARSSFVGGGDAGIPPRMLPSDGGAAGGSRGQMSPVPTVAPARRRKSVVEEMSAPWLRPVEPDRSADQVGGVDGGAGGSGVDGGGIVGGLRRDELGDGDGGRGSGGGAAGGAEGASSPSGRGPGGSGGGSAGGIRAGSARFTLLGAPDAQGSGSSGAGRDGSGGGGGGSPNPTRLMPPPTSSPLMALDGAQLETSVGEVVIPEGRGGGGGASTIGLQSTADRLRLAMTSPEAMEPVAFRSPPPQPATLARPASRASLTVPVSGGDGVAGLPPGLPRPVSSRRPGSALHPGSPFASEIPVLPEDREECLPGYAAEAPVPLARQQSSLRRQSSALKPQTSVASTSSPVPLQQSGGSGGGGGGLQSQPSGLRAQSSSSAAAAAAMAASLSHQPSGLASQGSGFRSQVSGGMPAPLSHQPSGALLTQSSSLRRQTSSAHRPPAGQRRQGTTRLSVGDSAGGSGGQGPVPGSGSGPGPVMESLVLEHPSTPTSTTPMDAAELTDPGKRPPRAAVSFTASMAPGEESADDRPSSRPAMPSRGLRVTSREASATAGSNSSSGQVMTGLRNMARNFTMKLGQVLGARNSDTAGGMGTEPGGHIEAPEGPGGAWGETTPRQSLSGGGGGVYGGGGMGGPDAMAVTVPNNPWEWQDAYDEKVDLWQVGCLVHEILCASLPFEADDKMLACALILWADVVCFPDHLSPECHDFIRACLTKNPAERPSAADLLQHPWIARHASGEVLKSVRQLKDDASVAGPAHNQPLTGFQRVASGVGLGWLVGAPAPAGRTSAGGATGDASHGRRGGWSWLWPPSWGGGSKVTPAGAGAGAQAGRGADREGLGKLEGAGGMTQEQQQASERTSGPQRSQDVETGSGPGARR